MRKIISTTFVTMDGVMQAPGGPEEDPTGGFKWGGWSFNYQDDITGNTMNDFMAQQFDLLLGRKTYEIFAAYWPFKMNDTIANKFNSVTKYVVSHHPQELKWDNSKLITGDAISELKELKQQEGSDLWVYGSGNLVQTLLKNELLDTLHMWICPLTIGKGKKILAEGTIPKNWKLIESKVSSSGVIIATYEPAGELMIDSYPITAPTKEELERRKKMKSEG